MYVWVVKIERGHDMFGRSFDATGRGRKLRIERLEEKMLLAGDVQVVVSDGALLITGDDLDNHVQVVATAVVGEYRVLGVNRAGIPTAINGVFGQIRVTGVNDDFKIDMQGGDSRVALLNGEFGAGGDILELVVPDDLEIRNSSGRLEVLTDNVRVLDDLVIETQDGFDDIALLETLVDDNLYISTHGGNDDVLLDEVVVEDNAILKLGDGENFASIGPAVVG